MDDSTKKACFDEISYQICDSDKKVNVSEIAQTWNLTLRDSEKVLWDWLELQNKTAFSKEYLIRGLDVGGHCFMSVLPEKQLLQLEQKCIKMCASLYSLERPSESSRAIGMHEISQSGKIQLPLEGDARKCKVQPIEVPPVTPKAVEMKTVVKLDTSTSSTKNLKNSMTTTLPSPLSEANGSVPKGDAVNNVVKPQTPKKDSPKKRESKTAKVVSGKASIAAFFSAKPAAVSVGKPQVITPKPNNVLTEMATENKSTASTKKRSAIDVSERKDDDVKIGSKRLFKDTHHSEDEDVIPATPQEAKKIRKMPVLKKSNPSNALSRIRQIVDSSDEEDMFAANNCQSEEIISTPSVIPNVSKENKSKTPVKVNLNRRRKATRMINRTYEDEEGYMKTVKELEEYSCSEEEEILEQPTEPKAIIPAPKESKVSVSSKSPATSLEEKEKPKKTKKSIPPPKSGKQGSILNFFTKK